MLGFNGPVTIHVTGPIYDEQLDRIESSIRELSDMIGPIPEGESLMKILDTLLRKVEESNTLQDGMIASQKEIARLIKKHLSSQDKLLELATALDKQAPETADALKANVDLQAELAALDTEEEEVVDETVEEELIEEEIDNEDNE